MALVAAGPGCSRGGRPPGTTNARLELAQGFLQKARETGNPTYYGKADQLLRSLAKSDPKNPDVLVARGTLAAARHQFRDALALGKKAAALAPGMEGALGVIVDASNELGLYDDALAATQQMVDVKPNLASLSRVSYARELRGDLQGAIESMAQAVSAGAGAGENEAYVDTQLGLLLVTTGNLTGAAAAFDAADRAFAGFVPARVGRARLLLAQGKTAEAAALLAQAATVQPLVETVALQGDALAASGDQQGAAKAYALVGAIAQLYRANGVKVDLEMALFDADHHPGQAAAAAAKRALKDRPSTLGHDVLAWSLYRAGQADAAYREIQLALRLGSRDPQLQFHAAAIALAAGHGDEAAQHLESVHDTNPRFSPLYQRELSALEARLRD